MSMRPFLSNTGQCRQSGDEALFFERITKSQEFINVCEERVREVTRQGYREGEF